MPKTIYRLGYREPQWFERLKAAQEEQFRAAHLCQDINPESRRPRT
ncbi:hypothetical protein [Kamptonema formosum]|nr:hypothetical protein [Oscillatoria sp. PCC 10802]